MIAINELSFFVSCLLSQLPGPPAISYQDSNLQLWPIDKTKCKFIDPVRDISFQLYTPHNPLFPETIKIGDDALLAASHFDFSKPTIIYFHAFLESSNSGSAVTVRNAFLFRGTHNVITPNAARLEAGPWYLTAAKNTMVVGAYTAQLIDYLVSKGMILEGVHLIGHSLGAQMAGVCGANVRSGRIPRITGLDPAGPLFTFVPDSLRLDPGDAEFVDVIHTDAGVFGFPRSMAHADFWPNGGAAVQPGCLHSEIKTRSPDAVIETAFCSHWRSYQFFAESVLNPHSFLSQQCDNWKQFFTGQCTGIITNMGLGVSRRVRGDFFLQTRDMYPFSIK
ncbi:pancreatic lipase-related protein 2-like [Agrilus planipennis]|uniref:Pancreatic lipase-related protein 2-like n=1 Tax=Agrilus planipennis TaxID=224129 RepID=A0A1W4X7R5_AGRPL|nr:pancreatic lipase-related protein 2-like [Agrilus planipennis]